MFGNEIQVLEVIPATFVSDLFNQGIRAGKEETGYKPSLSARILDSKDVAKQVKIAEIAGKDALLIPFEAHLFLIFEAIAPKLFRLIFP